MEKDSPKLTEAQKRAHQKYMSKFVEVKVRMTPEKRDTIKKHAESLNMSTTAFINHIIDEAIQNNKKIK